MGKRMIVPHLQKGEVGKGGEGEEFSPRSHPHHHPIGGVGCGGENERGGSEVRKTIRQIALTFALWLAIAAALIGAFEAIGLIAGPPWVG